MIKRLSFAISALALLAVPAQAAERLTGEARLAKLLEGRVAGPPVDCINLRRIRTTHTINKTAIVYRIGSDYYVNRPRRGAEDLDNADTLIHRTSISQLCSIDTMQQIDLRTGVMTGIVFLGDFVPYRKVR